MIDIGWADRVRNKVLHIVNGERNIIHAVNRRKVNWIGQILCRNCLLEQAIEGKVEGRIEVTERRGRRRKQPRDDLQETRGYCKFRQQALDVSVSIPCIIIPFLHFEPTNAHNFIKVRLLEQ
jgi:hypothetical protein